MPYKRYGRRILAILLAGILFLTNWGMNNAQTMARAADAKDYANVVVFAYFKGDAEGASYFQTNRAKILGLYDGAKNRSFTNYLSAVSYGKLRVKNYFPQDDGTTLSACALSVTEASVQAGGNMDTTIVSEILANIPALSGQVLDYDGDGYIDNLTVIMKSEKESQTSGNSLVAHHAFYPTDKNLRYGGKEVGHYNMINTPQFLGAGNTTMAQESGVLAHEFLHGLGFPDLYTSDGTYPVGNWDIMGGADYGMSYPLAYMRMKVGGWLMLDTVTTSQTLTLDTQDKQDGHPAYILKSPLNEQELFVVEFRKKDTGLDSYDRFIGGSGVIVYRINPAVEGLSNLYGQTGVYVFRPQPGQTGYSQMAESVYKAYLSKEEGRTTIGKSDLSAGLSDGALTFSDGTNSGIVISEVGSAKGSQITLKVDFPKVSDSAKWTDCGFASVAGNSKNAWNQIAMTLCGQKPYVLTYTKDDAALTLYSCEQDTWKKLYQQKISENYGNEIKLCSYNGSFYFAYADAAGIEIEKLDASCSRVTEKQTIAGAADFDMQAGADGVYLVYTQNNTTAYARCFKAGSLSVTTNLGSYYTTAGTNHFAGQPKLLSIGSSMYASIRNTGTMAVHTFCLDANGNHKEVSDAATKGSTYGMATDGKNLYVATCSEGILVNRYDGKAWHCSKMKDGTISDVVPVCRQGTLFVLTSGAYTGTTNLYRYDVANDQFAQEGVSLDSYSTSQTICAADGTLYVSYLRGADKTFVIKKKSVTVTPAPEPTPDPGTNPAPGTNPDPGTNPEPGTGGETTTTTEAPTPTPTPTPVVTPDVTVSYRTHIQTFGWENTWRQNGTMSGTSGKAKRLEGIEIKVSGNSGIGIQYTTHCQSYGWLPWSANGDMNGTQGEAKRLEAIKIQLTGSDKDKYDVYYRVHAQSYGWLGWAANGAPAGTAGYAKRLEGIQIVVVKKGAGFNRNMQGIASQFANAFYAAPGQSMNPQIAGADSPNVTYRTHVQSYGWQGWKYNGQMSGTSGQAKRLEGIEIILTNAPYSGGVCYTTHVQSYGWQEPTNNPSAWRRNGTMSGTSGQAKRLEAICIALTGDMQRHYDVYYRVHAQSFGWLGWAKNGAPAGTAGYAKRLEGIEIRLVPKGQAAPGSTARSYISAY